MVPYPTILIPLYVLLGKVNLHNSPLGVSLVLIMFQLPFATFMMRNAFEALPVELEDSAAVDRCGTLATRLRILIHVVRPAVVTVGLFAFLAAWNDFFASLILLDSSDKFTLPLAIVTGAGALLRGGCRRRRDGDRRSIAARRRDPPVGAERRRTHLPHRRDGVAPHRRGVRRGLRAPAGLSLRVPSWASGATLDVAGNTTPVPPGYASETRTWRPGDEVTLRLPVAPRWTWPDPRIDAVRDCAAVERGPSVYCVESVEQQSLSTLTVDAGSAIADAPAPPLRQGTVAVVAEGSADLVTDPSWPHRDAPRSEERTPRLVTLIPHHLWANRGPAEMRVFLPVRNRS
jgi:hypothetical protein